MAHHFILLRVSPFGLSVGKFVYMLTYFILLRWPYSVFGVVIPREFLVRNETYVFSENLVQKDYKKICLHSFTVLLLWKRFVSCDAIVVTVMKFLMTLESDVLYII